MALPDLTEHGYRVITPLGQGAEGVVYKALYIGLAKKGTMEPHQAVAIKFTPAAKVRPNEVLLQARIQHINVIRLYDVFRCSAQGLKIPCMPRPCPQRRAFLAHTLLLWTLVDLLVES